jgi:hypothetical protein
MKRHSYVSGMPAIILLFVILLFASCKKEAISTPAGRSELKSTVESEALVQSGLSETKRASFLNNLNNFRAVFGDQGYPRAKAEYVSADDGKYASTSKLTTNGSSYSSLALQGFGFTIPDNATINNISVRVRRFKTGSPTIGDYSLSLMQRYQCGFGPCTYGVFWTHLDNYPGKIYPSTETEYIFSQSGSGNNGGFIHDQAYQWTPAIVNHQYFGVRIDSNSPIGKGSVAVNYDLVEVTVEYSLP